MVFIRKKAEETENKTSRAIAETLIRKTLKDINRSPERSIRNIVDLASEVSNGRFQSYFFRAAQTMLKNEHSSYYALVEDAAENIEHERLVCFGLNIGYNSCTSGAKKIRGLEKKENFNIPWCVSLEINTNLFKKLLRKYNSIIKQGEKIGIYTWFVFNESCSEEVLSLAENHPESAFAFFCNPSEITVSFAEKAAAFKNIMLVIKFGEDTQNTLEYLRRRGFLYSVYYEYSDDDIDFIVSGKYFSETSKLHSPFSVLVSKNGCSQRTKSLIYDYCVSTRTGQSFPTVPWELESDGNFIDEIISGDSCSAFFDKNGYLFSKKEKQLNLFENDLKSIFKIAFPKEKTEE